MTKQPFFYTNFSLLQHNKFEIQLNSKIIIQIIINIQKLPMQLIGQQRRITLHKRKLVNLTSIVNLILILISLPSNSQSATLTVNSSSNIVGALTNYTFTIKNHTNPTSFFFKFGQWTPWRAAPYISSSNIQCYLSSGSISNILLNCRKSSSSTTIICNLTSTVTLGSTIQIIYANLNNPSSTMPYPISMTLISSSIQQQVNATLRATQVINENLSITNWNSAVGASSLSSWIVPINLYFDYSTILRVRFFTAQTTLSFGGVSGVFVNTSNLTQGMVTLSNWSDTTQGYRIINNINITNQLAVFPVVMNCTLQLISSNITYLIQNFTITLATTPSNFTTITLLSSNLIQGATNQTVSFTNITCPYTPVNRPNATATPSFTQISFSNLEFTRSSCTPNSTSNSTIICTYNTTTNPKTITGITQSIKPQTNTAITVTVYTFFAARLSYLPLCSTVFRITTVSQTLSNNTFNRSLCANGSLTGKTGQNNTNTILNIRIQNAAAGDIVTINSLLGATLAGSAWQKVGNTSNYRFTILSTHLNSTHINVPLQYSNPTYITTNALTNITVSRVSSNGTEYIYAIMPLNSSSLPLCPVTVMSDLQSFSFSLSSYLTYQSQVRMTIRFRNKFVDYSASDYILVQFRYYENILYLKNPEVLSSIKCSSNITTTSNNQLVNNSLSIINDTVINIRNIEKFNQVSTINQLNLAGLVNPAGSYPLQTGLNGSGFEIWFAFLDGTRNVGKQQFLVKFSSSSVQTAYTYTPSTATIAQSVNLPILTTLNSSLTITLKNTNKPKYYPSMASSNALITLPFTCTQNNNTNRTRSVAWTAFSGELNVTFTNCVIGYLVSNTSRILVNQTFNVTNSSSSLSTYTSSFLILYCDDNCQQCNQVKYCLRCVNTSTGSLFNLLYNGECFSTCPIKTFRVQNQPRCQNCHETCLTCNGSSMINCLTCPSFYTLKQVNVSNETGVDLLKNICVSVCGENMYINPNTNKCQQCEIDCKYCINAQICYVCKENANFVNSGLCDFVLCTSPCLTCEGIMSNCTSCITDMYWYSYQCLSECPANTYKSFNKEKVRNQCLDITSPTLYFPVTICSIVLLILVCICNACIQRNLTADSSRRNINMLTYGSSILAYMQLFAIFIMLAFTFNTDSIIVGVAGIVIWVICNILFSIYYAKVMRKDEAIMEVYNKMSEGSKCIYLGAVVCSIIITLRTYRVLYCGLFRGVAPYPVKKKIRNIKVDTFRERKGSQSKIINQDNIKITIDQSSPKNEPAKKFSQRKNTITSNNPGINTSKTQQIGTGTNNTFSNKTLKSFDTNGFTKKIGRRSSIVNQKKQQNQSVQSSEEHSKFQLKRPYLIYITLGSIIGSILFLSAGVNQIIKKVHPAMLYWGLDILIVVVFSIIFTALDMWAGIKKSYLIALQRGNVNEQTMQNLKLQQDDLTHQKIINARATQKFSKNNSPNKVTNQDKKALMKKYSPPIRKNSKSPKNTQKVLSPQQKQLQQKANQLKKLKNRYSDLYKRKKKNQQTLSQDENDLDQLPDIKVFQDIQIFTNEDIGVGQDKKIKKVKNNDSKRMNSVTTMRKMDNKSPMNNIANSTQYKGSKLTYKLNDIFLGFNEDDNNLEIDKKTLKLVNSTQGKQVYRMSPPPIKQKQKSPRQLNNKSIESKQTPRNNQQSNKQQKIQIRPTLMEIDSQQISNQLSINDQDRQFFEKKDKQN